MTSTIPRATRGKPSRAGRRRWGAEHVGVARSASPAGDMTIKTDRYRALKGYVHAYVNHTQKAYARGEVHENRAECLLSLLKPYLRVFRGISKLNLPGYVGFFQFLRNFRHQKAFEQAELILQAALDPGIASRANKGELVKCFDHFDLLQTARN
jgi:hypothetical protein